MSEEESREQVEELINNEEPVKEEPINEEIKEEMPKPKSKAKSRAKPYIKITKEPVEPIIEEEPTVDEPAPVEIYKLTQIAKCPDCNMDMTAHTFKYIHKRRGFCKAIKSEPEKTPEPEQSKPKITDEIVNDCKQNPEIVSTYLRNERSMKAQRKQMRARSLLNNA